MEKFILVVGLNDASTKKQEVTNEQAREIVMNTCGDCSIQELFGAYTHEDGTKVRENSLRVELYFKEDAEVRLMAQELKKRLNQESIIFSKEIVNSELI